MKGRVLLKTILYVCGILGTLLIHPPVASATCSGCGWGSQDEGIIMVGRWVETYYCFYYYDEINYYYCGAYQYTDSEYVTKFCSN